MLPEKIQDINGFVEIKANPISKAGIFPYLGNQISSELDPNQVYHVFRPAETLKDPECIESFKLLPWVIEHAMLGTRTDDSVPAESHGIHGVVGEDVFFDEDDEYLKANIKIFSETLASFIKSGIKELSLGYTSKYDLTPGVYDGQPYDAVQHTMRGNHLASVERGRCGSDVAVYDSKGEFRISLDSLYFPINQEKNKEIQTMPEELLDKIKEMLDPIHQRLAALEKGEEGEEILDEEEPMMDGEEEKKDGYDEEEKEEKKAEDAEEEKEEKKAEDAEEEKDEKKSMDKALSAKWLNLSNRINKLEKSTYQEMQKKINLANDLSRVVGTFDHSNLDIDGVVSYGLKKFGLKSPKGYEHVVLSSYLKGYRSSGNSPDVNTMDHIINDDSQLSRHFLEVTKK